MVCDTATYVKRPNDTLSAQNMPKFTPKEGTHWGPETAIIGGDGKPVYGPNRKVIKTKIYMTDGRLAIRTPQPLYFPQGHPQAGAFKGILIILQE